MNDFVFDIENENNKMSSDKVISYIHKTKEDVQNGHVDPLTIYHKLKNIEKTLKHALEEVKKEALPQVQENPLIIKDGYEYRENPGRKIWNFEEIGDWSKKKEILTKVEDKAKENFGKMNRTKTFLHDSGILYEEETGEEFILPIVTHSESSIEIKKIKK